MPALGRGGALTPEFKDFMVFADQVIGCWLEAATPGREMFACPEQIAGGYMLSVIGDGFKDVQAIRRELDRSFKRRVKKWKPPA